MNVKRKAIEALAGLFGLKVKNCYANLTVQRDFDVGGVECSVTVGDVGDGDGWIALQVEAQGEGWPRAVLLYVPVYVGDLGGLD